MSDLSEYNSLEEKEKYFTCKTIDTIDQFQELLSNNSSGSVWRGSNEAKFKIYSSLQRYWIENDLDNDPNEVKKYLESNIKHARKWKQEFLKRYYENYGIKVLSVYSILSILRHHGCPSPLIDWTTNPKVAIFFALSFNKNINSNDPINNYFSLYELRHDHPKLLFDVKIPIYESLKGNESEIRKINMDYKDDKDLIKKISEAILISIENFNKDLDEQTVFKIHDKKEDLILFYINNNYNIVNQEGLFLINGSPLLPLEEAIENEIIKSQMIEKDISKIMRARKRCKDNFICYNINKKLKEPILEVLKIEGVDEKFIYPNLYDLAKECKNEYENLKD